MSNKKEILDKNLLQANEALPKKFSLERASKWLALYAAVLTTVLTTYAWIEKFSPKNHSLEIYVADYQPNDETIEFTIAYYNTGDYSEVLSSVELLLAQEIKGVKNPSYWKQAQCNEPALIGPGKTVYKRYEAKVDFNNQDLKMVSTQIQKFELNLHFEFLSKEYGKASERFPVATLTPYKGVNSEDKASIDFMTSKQEVDFDDARPAIIMSTYPIEKKFVTPNFCGKKI